MIREIRRFDSGTSRMSGALLDQYWSGDSFLRSFYRHAPVWESFEAAMLDRDLFETDRQHLADELELQHQSFMMKCPLVKANIEALRGTDCYTVTTGHQLCLATGPLFFLYKIITTINLCKELIKRHPGKVFVPVYWMATEDHDIAEIDHFHVDGHAIRAGSHWNGPSGRQSVEELGPVWEELRSLLNGKPHAEQVLDNLRRSYHSTATLAEATRELVLDMFGDEGLIVIDADRPSFKRAFLPVMRKELFERTTRPIVEEVISRMQPLHKPQVHVRGLNLFYLQNNRRDRLVLGDDGSIRVMDTDLVFTPQEVELLLTEHPERFSPNVILRPLYQETILPNVATVGGPAEIAYWMLLQPLFESHGIPYPILVPRNQALLITSRVLDKFIRQGFAMDEMFLPADELTAAWLLRNENLKPAIDQGRKQVQDAFDRIAGVFARIDSTLEPSVRAEAQRVVNGLEQLERKGTAALKRRHELALTQVRHMADKIKPNGVPQERVENYSSFAATYGTGTLIRSLMDNFEPLDPRFTVLVTE